MLILIFSIIQTHPSVPAPDKHTVRGYFTPTTFIYTKNTNYSPCNIPVSASYNSVSILSYTPIITCWKTTVQLQIIWQSKLWVGNRLQRRCIV